MAERTLSAEEIETLCRLMWGNRHEVGSERLALFLGITGRNARRLIAGAMVANAGVSAELVAEFRQWLTRSPAPAARLIREVMEPHTV